MDVMIVKVGPRPAFIKLTRIALQRAKFSVKKNLFPKSFAL